MTTLLGFAVSSALWSDSGREFDPQTCFCFGLPIGDVSVGHFELDEATQAASFVVDVPLARAFDGSLRAPGEHVPMSFVMSVGPHLLYDTGNGSENWCVIPLGSSDLDTPQLVSTACGGIVTAGGSVPGDCSEKVSLREIGAFAERVVAGSECSTAVTRSFGIAAAEESGCNGAHGGGAVAFILVMARWSARARRRAR